MKKLSSYNQILKSTTILGGSQVFVILIGVIRTKIVAILLGTMGLGVIGVFYSIIDMMRSNYSLGIDTAGVKEIAEIDSIGNQRLLNITISRYNLWFRFAAMAAMLTCVIFSYPISIWTFGNGTYTIYIACLSISVFLAVLSTGRSVILQGMRKVPALAKSTIIAAFVGLLITAPLYYFWGIESIAYAYILTYIASFICVEFYYRKLKFKLVNITFKEAFKTGRKTLRLGFYILIGGSISTITMFVVRAYITRTIDIHAAGLFQSAWTITNVYLGFVLRSMGSDFFPRLSAISGQNNEVRKLVNEQSYMVLVIAPFLIVFLLLFSDIALHVLYSSDFSYADKVLRWQLFGTFFKVISWPMAFIMFTKNKGKIYLLSEVLFFVVYLLSSYLLMPKYGLDAVGFGYFIAYLFYLPMVYIISKKISLFKWDKNIVIMIIVNLILVISAFYISHFYSGKRIIVLGGIVSLLTLAYAYYNLKKVFTFEELKSWFQRRK
ncbi:MAG: O-antigen translocase [Dysgonomonas sp.]|nr:O-antigen translocase [Dysgonomonas sp.]